jgi:hypothetical protein
MRIYEPGVLLSSTGAPVDRSYYSVKAGVKPGYQGRKANSSVEQEK